MTWLRAILAVLLLSLMAAPAVAQPQFPPRPAGPVYDGADIIPAPDEAALDARLREYSQRTGRAVIVATVPTLQEDTIEDYAVRLFEAWGIGGAETDQGLLLLVAPNERKLRIEVGYGLHQYVTDILSGRIIRNDITPRFREGDFAGGINAGVDALITQLDRDPADAKAVAEAAAAAAAAGREAPKEAAIVAGAVFWVVVIVVFALVFGRGRRGRRYGRGGTASAVGEVLLWTAINAAMNSGRDSGGSSWGGGGWGGGGGGGGFGGFGGGMSGGGGASGSW